MRGGKLRFPAKVIREVASASSSGSQEVDYETVLITRVGITTVSGKEYLEGGAETMETTVKIVMRTPSKRVLMGDVVEANGREYKVMGVLDFDNRRSLQLMCKELV